MSDSNSLNISSLFIESGLTMIFLIFILTYEKEFLINLPNGRFLPKEAVFTEANSIEEGLFRLERLNGLMCEKVKLIEICSYYKLYNSECHEYKSFALILKRNSKYLKHLSLKPTNKFVPAITLKGFLKNYICNQEVKTTISRITNGLKVLYTNSTLP